MTHGAGTDASGEPDVGIGEPTKLHGRAG